MNINILTENENSLLETMNNIMGDFSFIMDKVIV